MTEEIGGRWLYFMLDAKKIDFVQGCSIYLACWGYKEHIDIELQTYYYTIKLFHGDYVTNTQFFSRYFPSHSLFRAYRAEWSKFKSSELTGASKKRNPYAKRIKNCIPAGSLNCRTRNSNERGKKNCSNVDDKNRRFFSISHLSKPCDGEDNCRDSRPKKAY